MTVIEREVLIRAATDWVESVLEHGDPAVRSGGAQFAAVVDDVLATTRGAVSAIREALEALDPDNGNRRESDITHARETLARVIEGQ